MSKATLRPRPPSDPISKSVVILGIQIPHFYDLRGFEYETHPDLTVDGDNLHYKGYPLRRYESAYDQNITSVCEGAHFIVIKSTTVSEEDENRVVNIDVSADEWSQFNKIKQSLKDEGFESWIVNSGLMHFAFIDDHSDN